MTAVFLFWLLICHFIGDYILQSHWMATQKTIRWWPAIAHGLTYTLPFAVLIFATHGVTGWTLLSLLVIGGTHVLIDHFRWAKHVGWLRNQMGPKAYRPGFSEAMANGGFNASTPIWLSSFLLFVSDNTIHVIINFLATVGL